MAGLLNEPQHVLISGFHRYAWAQRHTHRIDVIMPSHE
jgi:hypothetical protein